MPSILSFMFRGAQGGALRHRHAAGVPTLLVAILCATGQLCARQVPGPLGGGRTLLHNGWSLSPAGKSVSLSGIGMAMAVSPAGDRVAIMTDELSHVNISLLDGAGVLLSTVRLADGSRGLCWSGPSRLYVAGGRTGNVYGIEVTASSMRVVDSLAVGTRSASIIESLECDRDLLYIGVDSTLVLASLEQRGVIARIALEGRCRAVLHAVGSRTVYAALWDAAMVVAVDLDSHAVVQRARVGSHPCALVQGSGRIYVACSNDDIVTVLESTGLHVTHLLACAPFSGPRGGSIPCAMTLSPNGQYLFVANAGNNALVAYDVRDANQMSVVGWIPAGYSPVAIAMHGKTILVVNAFSAPVPAAQTTADMLKSELNGTLLLITAPGAAELRQYTQEVLNNIPYFARDRVDHCDGPVPDTGMTSPIKHVFLVVKEGRSYDEIYGDLAGTNGDPSRCRFPDSITPNHHALAREFTVCDNFFSDALVQEEGYQWLAGATATDVVRDRWPACRGSRGQPWIFTGESALPSPSIGYIWDYCEWKSVRMRIYGAFTETRYDTLSFGKRGVEDNFSGMVCQTYPSYDRQLTDTERVGRWADELRVFEQHKKLPGIMLVRLANDRITGRGNKSARALMADNDLALGRFVERVSGSPFWNQSAIFVVESDADGASDHVSPHRVPVLVISPYVRRGMVDTTMYTTSGLLKTVERIAGLPSMSQYDECARLMCAPFQAERNDEAYHARIPTIDLSEPAPGK